MATRELSHTNKNFAARQNNGAGGRTRTPDLLITNQLLYQLSYTSLTDLSIISHIPKFVKHFFEISQKIFSAVFGRGDRTRTCGILVPNQALYQTELRLGATIRCPRRTAFILYYPAAKKSIHSVHFCANAQPIDVYSSTLAQICQKKREQPLPHNKLSP